MSKKKDLMDKSLVEYEEDEAVFSTSQELTDAEKAAIITLARIRKRAQKRAKRRRELTRDVMSLLEDPEDK